MHIPDKTWDELNSFCCDLVEQLEAMPQDIFFACKKEAIELCYIILNMQDQPSANPWIPIEERVPPLNKSVLVLDRDKKIHMKKRVKCWGTNWGIDEGYLKGCNFGPRYTHWKELPELPIIK